MQSMHENSLCGGKILHPFYWRVFDNNNCHYHGCHKRKNKYVDVFHNEGFK